MLSLKVSEVILFLTEQDLLQEFGSTHGTTARQLNDGSGRF